MDELVKMISEKAGIPEAQARKAAEAAVEFMKDKAPAPLAGQIDSLLEGGASSLGGMLGGMLKR